MPSNDPCITLLDELEDRLAIYTQWNWKQVRSNWFTVLQTSFSDAESLWNIEQNAAVYDGVIKWKHLPRYWPFVRGIHRSPVNSLHKGQWRGALMFSLICAWINGWVNNSEALWFKTPSHPLWRHCNDFTNFKNKYVWKGYPILQQSICFFPVYVT